MFRNMNNIRFYISTRNISQKMYENGVSVPRCHTSLSLPCGKTCVFVVSLVGFVLRSLWVDLHHHDDHHALA